MAVSVPVDFLGVQFFVVGSLVADFSVARFLLVVLFVVQFSLVGFSVADLSQLSVLVSLRKKEHEKSRKTWCQNILISTKSGIRSVLRGI